ncbi:MAG: hypothetical protein ACI4WM_07230 [Erysipelotrichaceae bacterium]
MCIYLNDSWKFFKKYGEDGFKTVMIPHTELSDCFYNESLTDNRYAYQRVLPFIEEFRNRRIFLHIVLKKNSTILFNDKEVFHSEKDGTYNIEITRLIRKEDNIIQILTAGTFLNDEIYLLIKEKTFIKDVSFKQKYQDGNYILNCFIEYDGKLNGYETVAVKLLDKEGNEVFNTSFSALLKEYSFNVGRVYEWSKDNPYLYTIEFDLNGARYTDYLGFRNFTYDGNNLYFNSVPFKGRMLSYENIHPYVNDLVNSKLIEDDLDKIRKLGADIILVERPDETLLNLCDRYGLMAAVKSSCKDHSCIVFYEENSVLHFKDSEDIYAYQSFSIDNLYVFLKNFRKNKSGIFDFGNFADNDYNNTKGILDFFRNTKQNSFNNDENYHLYSDGSRYLLNGDFDYLKLYYEDEYLGILRSNELDTAVINDIPDYLFKKKYNLNDRKFASLMNVLNDMRYYENEKIPLIARLHRIIFRMKNEMSEFQLSELYSEYQCLHISDNLKFELFKDNKPVTTIKKKKTSGIHYSLEISDTQFKEADSYDVTIVRIICRNEDNEILADAAGFAKASVKGRIALMSADVCVFKNGISTFYIRSNGSKGKGSLLIDVPGSHFETEFTIK